MPVITIKLAADFIFTRSQLIRLEFTDPKTEDVVILEGLVCLEEIGMSLDEESPLRRSRAISRLIQAPMSQTVVYEGHYEVVGVSSENLKDADSAAETKLRRVLDLQNIND